VTRLFIFLPDSLPDSLDGIVWRMAGGKYSPSPGDGEARLPSASDADEIWLALPASRVLLSSLTLSRRALRQLNGALGNALEDRLMLDPGQAHVALGKPSANDVHPVAVIEIAWLEQALALCRRHGIEPFGAIPETLLWSADTAATMNAAPAPWSARWRGHGGFVRSGASAGFALDDGSIKTPPLALQLALAEARRQASLPSAIVLEADVDVDAAAWSRSLDCPVQLQPLCADPRPPALNLLQGPYASRRRGSSGWFADLASGQQIRKFRLAAGLVAAALAVHVFGTLADWGRLSWENRRLRAEMHQVFKEAFPQTQAIVDPSLQMQRQLADLRRARGYAESGDFLHVLAAAGGQIGGAAGLSYDNGRLTLAQPRATDVDGLRSMLATQGYQLAVTGEASSRSVSIERSRP